MEGLFYTSFSTTFGMVNMAWGPKGLIMITFPGPSQKTFTKGLEKRLGGPILKDDNSYKDIKKALKRYFEGERVLFKDVPLDLSASGGAFEQEVWQKIREIPYGRVRSYGWLARGIGRPRAARAVGRACGRNPLPPIIPCHRVVGARGELVGYSGQGGLKIKRRLLELEAVFICRDSVGCRRA